MDDPFAPNLLERLPRPPRKIAMLRASRIGDFICATPALRALRTALPRAELTMITLPMLRDLALRSPHIDRYAPFPGYPGIAEQLFGPRDALRFLARMQDEAFDLAVQLQGSGVNSNPFVLMLGAAASAGWVRPGDGPGRLDAALPLPEEGHEIRRVLSLTTFLGAPPRGERTEYPLWPEDRVAAAELLRGLEPPLIGLHPAARDRSRRWALDRFAAVGNELQRRHGGSVVIVAEAEEAAAAEAVGSGLRGRWRNLAGRTTLPVLGAVIERLAALITNDTGPAHIAYALGTPTVAIFGSGDPTRYGPPVEGPFVVVRHPVALDAPPEEAGEERLARTAVAEVVAAAEAALAFQPAAGPLSERSSRA